MNEIEKAFVEALYLELASKLERYARNTLGDPALAEEAVQDTFRVVCAKIETVMASSNPQGWVTNAMTLELKKISEQRARQEALLARLAQEESRDGARLDEENPDTLYQNLTDNEDYILLRRFADSQCTVVEFAKELGISPDSCGKRLQRARKRLEKFFRNS